MAEARGIGSGTGRATQCRDARTGVGARRGAWGIAGARRRRHATLGAAQRRAAGTGVGERRGARGAQAEARGIGRAAQSRALARAQHGAVQVRGLGVQARPAGCALGALSMFDPVLTQYCS